MKYYTSYGLSCAVAGLRGKLRRPGFGTKIEKKEPEGCFELKFCLILLRSRLFAVRRPLRSSSAGCESKNAENTEKAFML